jgi:biotin carboxyl carrier protein
MSRTEHERSDPHDHAQRRADHAAMERLASRLVPVLAARLEATGMAEIEVTEEGARVRVRRTVGAHPSGVADSVPRGHGRVLPALVAVGPGALDGGSRTSAAHRTDPGVATSPAVGYFSPAEGIGAGSPVAAGERIGSVDVLGVGHEVAAPIDGVVTQVHIEPGQAVEYGQTLVTVEPPGLTGDGQPLSEA